MVNLKNVSMVFIIAGVTYDFTMMGEDDEVLCLRKMNTTTWRDAFRYFSILMDGSARYEDALHNIMMELCARDDMAESMANADYEHSQSMYNPDGTIG